MTMSSILDALKKLEQEKEEQREDFDWPQPVNTKSALYESVTRRPSYKPFVAGAVVLLAVSLGTWFVMGRHSKPQPEKTVAAKTVTPPPRADVAKSAPMEPRPEPMKTFKPIPRNASQLNKRQEGPPPDFAQRRRPEPGPEPMVEPGPEPQSKAFTDEQVKALAEIMPQNMEKESLDLKAYWDQRIKEELPQEDAPVASTTQPAEPEQAELDEDMAELLERVPKEMLPPKKLVDSGWLKLQAISWSDDPTRRIAVINSNLVKEGRQIDGAVVSRIERDYVVIEKNGEELMLPFGNH